MATCVILLSCTAALLVQSVYGECYLHNSYNVGSCGAGLNYNEYALPVPWLSGTCGGESGFESGVVRASDGGGLAVKSASPFLPGGVSVVSENEYTGSLAVGGQLPFLGTAHLEGAVPSAGAGAVTYGCGYGDVRIVSEDYAGLSGADIVFVPQPCDFGHNSFRGCGCGRQI